MNKIREYTRRRLLGVLFFPIALVSMSGCAAVALTGLGIAGGVAANHALSGIAYKTFTKPIKTVEKASVRALGNMGVVVESKDVKDTGEKTILAKTENRKIEIILEPISEMTTRMRAKATRNDYLMDQATATEIIIQTERVLDGA